jgi:hypothetical protein
MYKPKLTALGLLQRGTNNEPHNGGNMSMNSAERATLLRDLMARRPALPVDGETFINDTLHGSLAHDAGAPFDATQVRGWKMGWLDADERRDGTAPLLVALSNISVTSALSTLGEVVFRSIGLTQNDFDIAGDWIELLAAVRAAKGGTKTHLVIAACALARFASWELPASEQRLKDFSSDPHFTSGEST